MPKKTTQKTEKTFCLGKNVYTDSHTLAVKFKENQYQPFYSLFVRTYAPEEEVQAYLRSQDNLDEWAYIVHDKDVLPDGTPKQPHIHVLLYRKNGFALTKMIKIFTHNTLVQVIRNRLSCYRYLTHKDNPEKYAYDDSKIREYHVGGQDTFKVTRQESREQSNKQMLYDIQQLSRRQMGEKYGRDYMLNFRRYEDFASVVSYEDMNNEIDDLARDTSPAEECVVVFENEGDITRLTLASVVCKKLYDSIASQETMPDSREILTLYYETLQEYRKQRRSIANALHINEVEL